MAGLLGVFGRGVGREVLEAGLGALICDAPDHHRPLGGGQDAWLGISGRHGWEYDVHEDPDSRLLVAAFGPVLVHDGRWKRLRAGELAELYGHGGIESLQNLDGSFVIQIVDRAAARAFVLNDATGSIPVFWAEWQGRLGCAPEAKALFPMLDLEPTLCEEGAIQFLDTGHPWGGITLFEGVHRLEPAGCLEVDLHRGSGRERRYWSFPSKEGPLLDDPRRASDLLFDVIREAMRSVPVVGASDCAIALTGGFDSRVVLALRAEAPACRYRSFSWGEFEDIPASDPHIARRLAEMEGVPHTFLEYHAGRVGEEVREWLRVSELLSDNMGYCAAGRGFLEALPLPELVLTGDHCIGLGPLPSSVDEAVEAVTTVPPGGVNRTFSEILDPGGRAKAAEFFSARMGRILSEIPSASPKEVQDALYHRIHLPGWLYSPGFFKEPAVMAFRPLMLRSVLETVSGMAEILRSDKIVFVKMLRRCLPGVARVPVASAFSLIDWSYESVHDEALRTFLEGYTGKDKLERTPLAPMIDWDRLDALRQEFFTARVARESRAPSHVPVAMEVRRLLVRHWALRGIRRHLENVIPKGLVGRPPARSRRAVFRIVARLALLSLFIKCIEDGTFGPAPERANQR